MSAVATIEENGIQAFSRCIQCNKDFGGDYPDCHLIENYFPELQEVKNGTAKATLISVLAEVQKTRCEFFHWLITAGFAEPSADNPMLYELPKDKTGQPTIELRPEPMRAMEAELIKLATAGFQTQFATLAEQYKQRTHDFFFGQQDFLVEQGKKF